VQSTELIRHSVHAHAVMLSVGAWMPLQYTTLTKILNVTSSQFCPAFIPEIALETVKDTRREWIPAGGSLDPASVPACCQGRLSDNQNDCRLLHFYLISWPVCLHAFLAGRRWVDYQIKGRTGARSAFCVSHLAGRDHDIPYNACLFCRTLHAHCVRLCAGR